MMKDHQIEPHEKVDVGEGVERRDNVAPTTPGEQLMQIFLLSAVGY